MNTDIEMNLDEEYRLPSTEAFLAATLALMTGHAEARCAADRQLMNAKVVSTLSQLAEHQDLSLLFRAALWSLLRHWQALQAEPSAAPAPHEPRLWHASPSLTQ